MREITIDWRTSANAFQDLGAKLISNEAVSLIELLKKYKYPPDQRPEAVRLIMEQALLFGEEWAVVTTI